MDWSWLTGSGDRRLPPIGWTVLEDDPRRAFPATYSQAVPASSALVPLGQGRQQKAPPGFRSGLQSCGPRFAQTFPPSTHSPPAARQASGPELEQDASPAIRKTTSAHTFICYLLSHRPLDLSNGLAFTCGRPSAADRQVQRLVRQPSRNRWF